MISRHVRSLLLAKRISRNENEAPHPAPPPPRFARYASSSGPPPPLSRGRMVRAISFSQRDPRRSFIQGEVRIDKVCFAIRHSPLAFFFPQIKRGGGTPANAGHHRRILRCGTRPAGRARLSAFHHGSHLRELFHPKGSASGQASWDAVCTGVTRLRLSQSREAPPTPVIMPGDMMPKPPESGLQIHPRAPHPLHLTACLR